MNISDLTTRFKKGEKGALSRALSMVENEDPVSCKLLSKLSKQGGGCWTVGLTGPPGSGKSTLADKLIRLMRDEGKSVGVLAIDPSSPFSGGALLGDRIRMQEHTGDEKVFIRSMASRGSRGGLALHTREAAYVMRAFGFDYLILETVGTGQLEMDVMSACDTCIVIQVPGSGDDIQMIKAGILEIGDIYVVNMADREGAVGYGAALSHNLESRPVRDGWPPPVMLTAAVDGTGVDAVLHAVKEHRKHLKSLPDRNEKLAEHREEEFFQVLIHNLESRLRKLLPGTASYDEILKKIRSRDLDIFGASGKLLDIVLKEDFHEPA